MTDPMRKWREERGGSRADFSGRDLAAHGMDMGWGFGEWMNRASTGSASPIRGEGPMKKP
jgi:hypothetical protein